MAKNALTPPFAYWKPGSEERYIHIFMSHRWGQDRELYEQVLSKLRSQGHCIDDVSLNERQQIAGPRGGDVAELNVQAEVAARIFTAEASVSSCFAGSPVELTGQCQKLALLNSVQLVGGPNAKLPMANNEKTRAVARRADWPSDSLGAHGLCSCRGPPEPSYVYASE